METRGGNNVKRDQFRQQFDFAFDNNTKRSFDTNYEAQFYFKNNDQVTKKNFFGVVNIKKFLFFFSAIQE